MGFFSRLVSTTEAAEHNQKKAEAKAKDLWIQVQRKIHPSRSVASLEAEWEASQENSPRARDKRLFEADKQHWEDIAAGKIPKDTPLPSKAWFDSLSPQEQQAEQNRKQQNFQASQIRAHNDRVESLTRQLQNNIALYGRDNANSVFMETELKKLTAQQPVFAPIGAAPIVNVTVAQNAPSNNSSQLVETDNDELWEQAAAELESGERKEALWIKCFSQSGGDENKAKALYYEARVKQLSQDLNTSNDLDLSSNQEPVQTLAPQAQAEPIKTVNVQPQIDTSSKTSAYSSSAQPEEKKSNKLVIFGAIGAVVVGALFWMNKGSTPAPTPVAKAPAVKQAPPAPAVTPQQLKANTGVFNGKLNSLYSAKVAWIQGQNFAFIKKGSVWNTQKISPAMMADSSYATPQESAEIRSFVTYNQNLGRTIKRTMDETGPLQEATYAYQKLSQEFESKNNANMNALADGKITYGQFNTMRKNDGDWYDRQWSALDAKYPS